MPEYVDNINNYLQSGNLSQEIINVEGNTMKSCTLVFTGADPFGTVCLSINILSLVEEVLKSFKNVQYEKSGNRFYLLKPIYEIS